MGKKTERISLRTIAFLFPEHSVQRVYLHGLWQRSRNRNPTLTLSNQRDPRLAFEMAQEMVGDYFATIRRIPYSRQAWFWSEERVAAILASGDAEDVATCS